MSADLFDQPKRHLLKDGRVVEISAVTMPAQKPAMILLRKSGASDRTPIVMLKSYQHMPEKLAYGIAAVSTVDGEPYFDFQGDHIPTDELVKMAHGFISDSRVGGALHLTDPETGKSLEAGKIVESVVLTKDLQKALGIDLGSEPWLIGMKVTDPHVLKMIEAGHLQGFSIGGRGVRTPATDAPSLFGKRRVGRPRIDRHAAVDSLMAKAEVAAFTVGDAERMKRHIGIFKGLSNVELISALTPDPRPEAERIASAADVLRKCLASPPHEAEKFDAYAARIAKGETLFQTETVVIKGMHAMTSSKQDTVAKAQAALADFAKQIKTNTGCSDAQAFAKAAAAHPAEYLALKSLGAFAVGLGDPLARSGPKPGAVRKAISPQESDAYYATRADDTAARDGIYCDTDREDSTGNVNHSRGNVPEPVEAALARIQDEADEIQKSARGRDGKFSMSRETALAKAYGNRPADYVILKQAGYFRH